MGTVGTPNDDIWYREGDFDDVIDGLEGDDVILGLGGDDKLKGGKGDDHIDGGTGVDKLIGGKGDDQLTGGEGEDTFYFKGKDGKDKILDFDIDNDILQIKASDQFQDVKDVVKAAKQKDNGDLVIKIDDKNTITLKNVDKEDFKTNPGDHIEIV